MQSKREIFWLEFIKRGTGELRQMSCRYGVHQPLEADDRKPGEDGGSKIKKHEMITVFDLKNGYRHVPLENLLKIHLRGKRYCIPENQLRLQGQPRDMEEMMAGRHVSKPSVLTEQSSAESTPQPQRNERKAARPARARALSAPRPSKKKAKKRKGRK